MTIYAPYPLFFSALTSSPTDSSTWFEGFTSASQLYQVKSFLPPSDAAAAAFLEARPPFNFLRLFNPTFSTNCDLS